LSPALETAEHSEEYDMKCAVIFHGDCDGVISAGLYIKHFLLDYIPDRIVLRFSHPWRLHRDIKEVSNESAGVLVLLDLALNEESSKAIEHYLRSTDGSVTIIDHHASSEEYLKKLGEGNPKRVKYVWLPLQSTPMIIAQLVKNLNSYERFLVNVANVCEGGDVEDETVKMVADKIKLYLSIAASSSEAVDKIVDKVYKIIGGREFWHDDDVDEVYRKAKWLLEVLIKRIEQRAIEVCGWHVATFTSAESLIFAGLFGVAASEYSKRRKVPVAIVRKEQGKTVVTIRSHERQALALSRHLSSALGGIAFGGHVEASSVTLPDLDVNRVVEEISRYVCRENHQ